MIRVLVLMLSLSAIGCNQEEPPVLAGGRPITERIDSARSGGPKVRKASVAKLGNVGEANPDAYAAVVEALHDKDANVRCEAIVSLLKFGDAAREKLTEVEELSKRDPSAKVRKCAAKAAEKLKEPSVKE